MSWTGTVRCRHCWKEGHNRRTCPELRENMTKRLENNSNDVWAQQYFRKQSNKKKKCSYCDGYGHTRPTCKELKYAKKVAIEKCRAWRVKLVEKFRAMGLGVGALVRYKNWSEEVVGIVTEIKWKNLTHLLQHGRSEYGFVFNTADLQQNSHFQAHLPVIEGIFESDYRTTDFKLVSPISPESFDKQIPEMFLSSEDCIRLVFQEHEVSKYKTAWYDISDWCPKQGFYND